MIPDSRTVHFLRKVCAALQTLSDPIGHLISPLETDIRKGKLIWKVDIEHCALNPYFGICQQSSDKAIVSEVFLKKPLSCRRRMTHAELPCKLPFASPSLLCLLSSVVHLSLHPRRPLPPPFQPCLNLLKRRCGLTVVISYHATTVLCVTSAQYTLERSSTRWLWIPTPWRGIRDLAIPGPANTVMFYTHPPPQLGVCVRSNPCVSKGGFMGLRPPASHCPARWPLRSWRVSVTALGINNTKGPKC